MTNEIKRIFIPAHGSETEKVVLGKELLTALVQKSGKRMDGILFCPTKRNIDRITVATAFGQQRIKALLKNKHVGLPNGGRLTLESEKTFRNTHFVGVILCVYPTQKMLNLIDETRNAHAIIVVPWSMNEEIEEWVRAWNPIIYGQNNKPPEALIDNPVVEKALTSLTARINLSTGLLHPSDKAAAVQILRILRDAGEFFDPSSVRAWALRHGWNPKGAAQLKEVAQAILDRKSIRGGSRPVWHRNILSILREETNNNGD